MSEQGSPVITYTVRVINGREKWECRIGAGRGMHTITAIADEREAALQSAAIYAFNAWVRAEAEARQQRCEHGFTAGHSISPRPLAWCSGPRR